MADIPTVWNGILKYLPPTLSCPLFAFVVFTCYSSKLYLALVKKFALNPLLELVCAASFLVVLLALAGILCYSMISFIRIFNRERQLNIAQLEMRAQLEKGKRIALQEMKNVVEFFERQK